MHAVVRSLNISLFCFLCLLNLGIGLSFFDPTQYTLVIGYYMAILLNQYFLIEVVGDMTGLFSNSSLIPTWLMAVLKLLILITGVLVAVHYLPNHVHIIMGIYIFQLIILALSTKRIVKKN